MCGRLGVSDVIARPLSKGSVWFNNIIVIFCFNSISDHICQVFTSLKVHVGCIKLWFIRGSGKHKDEAETSNRYGMKSPCCMERCSPCWKGLWFWSSAH